MAFDLDPSYKEVPERIADFAAKNPNGRLRPVNPDQPYKVEVIGDKVFIVYTAACYLSPDDTLPGIGVAWEPFPGRTPYTKDSELQNAETSAWGRAIVAALQSEAKRIASAEDVRNRRADAEVPKQRQTRKPTPAENGESPEYQAKARRLHRMKSACDDAGLTNAPERHALALYATGKAADWDDEDAAKVEAAAVRLKDGELEMWDGEDGTPVVREVSRA